MKKSYLLLLSVICFFSKSQVFVGTGGAVINNGGQETAFNLSVTGLSQIDSLFGLEEVSISLNHAAVEEVQVYLKCPSGNTVDLSGVLSCKGANFTNTTFKNNSLTSVTTGSAPYTGTFIPVGNIGRFNTNKPGNGTWTLYVKDFVTPANTGSLVSWNLKFGNNPSKPVILTSSNLPLVFITTPGNQSLSDNDLLVNFSIIDNGSNRNNISDSKNDYDGKANCHTRGSSSKMFEKKNIKVELTDNTGALNNDASLLGMPAESDWVLTANYSDKTMIRNALTHYLFQSMGHYSPRFKFVELFINGEYNGVYLLMEQIKRGKSRVDISKIAPIDNQFPYITGGYIFQINRSDNPGWTSLKPGVSANSAHFYYQYNYPKDADISTQQKGYIKSVVDSFETVMSSTGFNNPTTGYKKWIDDDSFIDFLILNELSKNVDAYRLSTYMYKDDMSHGGKIHIGPMWDYDIAWHNVNYSDGNLTPYWQFEQPNDFNPPPIWWTQLMQDVNFKNKLYCRYKTIRQTFLSNSQLFSYIDGVANLLTESTSRNFRQFPIIGAYIYPNPQSQSGATYATEISDLKQWITNRGAWLDTNVPGFCNSIGFNEDQLSENGLNIFPNPFSNSISIKFNLPEISRVKIELYNLLGEKVVIVNNEEKVKGEHKEELYTQKLPEGTYILRLELNGQASYRKIIKG